MKLSTMTLLGKFCITAFHLILFVPADALFDKKNNLVIAAEQRLVEDLFRGYEKTIRPTEIVSKPVNIAMSINIVDILELDENRDVLNIVIWERKSWKDVRLRWDSNNYTGVTQINLPNKRMWTPDIVPYNNLQESYSVQDSLAVVSSDGIVRWNPTVHLYMFCTADWTKFPFDKQECSVQFSSWTYDGSQVNLTYAGKPEEVVQMGPNLNDDWTVVKKTGVIRQTVYSFCPQPYVDLKVTLNLERNPSFYSHIFIAPAIFLGLLVPFQLLLPPDSKERLTLGSFLLMSQLFMNYMLLTTLPNAKSSVPTIQMYYLLTLVWNTLLMIASIIVLNAHYRGVRLKKVPDVIRKIFLGALKKMVFVGEGQLYDVKGIYNPAASVSEDGQSNIHDSQVSSMPRSENDQLSVYLQMTSNVAATSELKHKISSEWRQVALVLDRTLFVIFFVMFILYSIILVK